MFDATIASAAPDVFHGPNQTMTGAAVRCPASLVGVGYSTNTESLGLTKFLIYLGDFADLPPLRERVSKVLHALPPEVQNDFLEDPKFRVALDDCEPGKGRIVIMPDLGPNGASRCVVLKPRLARCEEKFACYIIAHEFAHAFLRNGGWGEITDREEAADALAASWGFERVAIKFWERWLD